MKIAGVAHSLPSKLITNDEIIDLVRFHSKDGFVGDLENTLRRINVILKKTGANTRYWLNTDKRESPLEHIKSCVDSALEKANMKKSDIDVLIYVGVGKGFLEPANSYMVAHSLGMESTRCFDILDACMSWSTGLQLADSLFKVGAYKNAMIVNGEFNVTSGNYGKFSMSSESEFNYTFPTYTIGEGASCTILTSENPENFKFNFLSKTSLADLCNIPLNNFQDYCANSNKNSLNGPFLFTSYGIELHEYLAQELPKLLQTVDKEKIDIVFTHASSKSDWQKYAAKEGLGEKVFHIYQKTGNLVSASVPIAISMALDDQKLKRGDQALGWIGSAGMSFASYTFTY